MGKINSIEDFFKTDLPESEKRRLELQKKIAETEEEKDVKFNMSRLYSLGLNFKLPIFGNGIKTEEYFLKTNYLSFVLGVEYLFGSFENTYSFLGKNALIYNFGVQFNVYNVDKIFINNNEE